jgi:transposase-like protein
LVYFSHFGMLHQEKSCQPCPNPSFVKINISVKQLSGFT